MALVAIGVVVITIAAVVGVAVVASGGGSGSGSGRDGSGSATRDATERAPVASTAVVTLPPDLPVATAAPPPSGVAYTDPQGTYTLTIDPAWVEITASMAGGVEAWAVDEAVGAPAGGVTPNVTVVTQIATGIDLATYLATSVAAVSRSEAVLVDERLVTVDSDRRLGVVHYRTTATDTAPALEFLAVVDVVDGTAVVATLTAPAGVYAALAARAEPYLATLRTTR